MDTDDPFEEVRERSGSGNPMWRVFVEYGRGERFQFLLGGVASVFARAAGLIPPLVLGLAIDALFFDVREFQLPLVPQAWVPPGTWGQFWLTATLLAGAFLVGALLNWVNNWSWNHFAQHIQHELRIATYDTMQTLELEFFDSKQTGEIMSILNNDVNQLENFLTSNFNAAIRILVMVGGTGVIMFFINWQLALVSFVVIPILGGLSYWFVSTIHPKYRSVRSAVGSLNSRLENNLGGIEVIKAYNTERFETGRVETASRDYLEANWDAIATRIKFFPAMEFVTGLGFVLTFTAGGLWVLFPEQVPFQTALTPGVVVMFLMYSQRFMWPMRQMGQIINSYQYAVAAGERIFGLIDEPNVVAERKDAVELETVDGRVKYDSVDFRYESGGGLVLDDVNFTVEPGEMVGLVGTTGSGKTTLLKLLMRFYDVTDGAIRVDGTDVRDVTLTSLRQKISYVGQESFLFYGTVRENIAYGNPTISDASIRDAAKLAGAHEFIKALPDGYDTMVGERGVKLSGGQRQRVSIARAILTDPEILVLDEATSHVDNETEIVIQAGLEKLTENRTTFAIAHHLSTVRDADQILVLDNGELVEQGTHEELLAEDGRYANLWRVQVGELEMLPEEFIEKQFNDRAESRTDD
ncbi:ABC transporter ATP-binding protein [Haloprofundus salinisoli]|uniref:ABC transporter ATP-binding protein n=1 Tax=Haloprofundus salinisoli TaxID=2876193 RepID=UPI001CC9A24F|nr:ABC transporter ATP-binding protein [Haloprofundus salinisoli]